VEGCVNYRRLGRTGLDVSEVGYGAWGIGKSQWIGAEDDESLRALYRAIDLGLNLIDTALAYGKGHSERLVGRVVKERGETLYVATKIPPKNLGFETIDVQQFHVWSDEWVGRGSWLEAVEDLKSEGKIRFFGVSINDHQPSNAVRLIETGVVDTVQVIYNVFDQSPEDELFPACRENDVGVIVRVPFDEGALTGRITPETTFDEDDFRNDYFRDDRKVQVYERVRAIVSELGIAEDEMAEVALRYVLSHPAVSTVIPGMRSVRNVERNMAVADGEGLPDDQAQRLKAHRWDRNFYA
jgi:aryl-alcohol dehydrogenase-like predicted oxidoreductase